VVIKSHNTNASNSSKTHEGCTLFCEKHSTVCRFDSFKILTIWNRLCVPQGTFCSFVRVNDFSWLSGLMQSHLTGGKIFSRYLILNTREAVINILSRFINSTGLWKRSKTSALSAAVIWLAPQEIRDFKYYHFQKATDYN